MEASSTPFDRQTNRTDGASQGPPSNRKALTIGAVAKILGREFEDVSISKIRYLEDQKLLSPRRTPGGYRLYSQADVERLRAILRMQRDEFLPLRVIRQELAAGARQERGESASLRRAASVEASKGSRLTLEELVDETGVAPDLIKDLEDWRLVQPGKIDGTKVYDDTDREIVKACSELARFGVGGRNLKVLRTAAIARRCCSRPWSALGFALRTTTPVRRRSRISRALPRRATTSPTCFSSATCGSSPARSRPSTVARVVRRRRIAAPPSALWDVITDPYHLPRWWPNTQRVENVSEGDPAERSWTQVLGTRGGRGVRADFRCIEESDGERYVFEQTVEGTPFERFVRRARTEIELKPQNGDTQVTMALDRQLRGLSRLGSPMMRRAIGRTLNEALDGLETAATGAEG